MDNTIHHGTVTITVSAPTLRMRELARKVAAKLVDTDVTPQTRNEFASIVAYTKSVTGLDWKPPHPQADKRELEAALEEYLDAVPLDLADAWIEGIFPTKPAPQK